MGGPDVTQALKATLSNIETTFRTWSVATRVKAAKRMNDIVSAEFSGGHAGAADAWDIIPLYEVGSIGPKTGYNRISGIECGVEPWKFTVGFEGRCYYAGQVNYAMYGKINKLVYDFLKSAGPLGNGLNANDYSLMEALKNVHLWKSLKHDDSPIYEEQALGFTVFGYDGGSPISALPCSPSGRVADKMFNWVWEPGKTRGFIDPYK